MNHYALARVALLATTLSACGAVSDGVAEGETESPLLHTAREAAECSEEPIGHLTLLRSRHESYPNVSLSGEAPAVVSMRRHCREQASALLRRWADGRPECLEHRLGPITLGLREAAYSAEVKAGPDDVAFTCFYVGRCVTAWRDAEPRAD